STSPSASFLESRPDNRLKKGELHPQTPHRGCPSAPAGRPDRDDRGRRRAAGGTQTYVVLYKASSVAGDAASTVQKAGGTLVYAYPQIGVVIARSDSESFRDNLLKDSRIDGASSTAGFAYQLPNTQVDDTGAQPGAVPSTPATDADSLSGLQWDMRQIKPPQAPAITGGS